MKKFLLIGVLLYSISAFAKVSYYYYKGTQIPLILRDDSVQSYTPVGYCHHQTAYKGGTAMQSNMENVSRMGDGMRLLPNGQHFSDSVPALISLAYEPNRIPMGYKPKDI